MYRWFNNILNQLQIVCIYPLNYILFVQFESNPSFFLFNESSESLLSSGL